MANSEVAVFAEVTTAAALTLDASGGATPPGIRISLHKPAADRGNAWQASAAIAPSDAQAQVVADADAAILRIFLPATPARRTLGWLKETIEAIDHDGNGDPFDASVSYTHTGTAGTVVGLSPGVFVPEGSSFSGGSRVVSPPVDLTDGAALAVGDTYRLQAQSEGVIWITEQPTSSGAPDTSTVPAFLLPTDTTEFWIEPEDGKTIWVFAGVHDGIVAVNG